MKAKGMFMFKSIQERESGSFTNKETGEVINYDSCYILVADEIEESNEITERRFKIAKEDIDLINLFNELEPYTKMEMDFDVKIYGSNAKLIPIDFTTIV